MPRLRLGGDDAGTPRTAGLRHAWALAALRFWFFERRTHRGNALEQGVDLVGYRDAGLRGKADYAVARRKCADVGDRTTPSGSRLAPSASVTASSSGLVASSRL